jgi:hypothetical protein
VMCALLKAYPDGKAAYLGQGVGCRGLCFVACCLVCGRDSCCSALFEEVKCLCHSVFLSYES